MNNAYKNYKLSPGPKNQIALDNSVSGLFTIEFDNQKPYFVAKILVGRQKYVCGTNIVDASQPRLCKKVSQTNTTTKTSPHKTHINRYRPQL